MRATSAARPARPQPWSRTLLAFGIVGGVACLVHLLVVSLLVPLGIAPLLANIGGFLTALGVSYAGHERWSFPSANRVHRVAVRRFFTVAVTSFAANETLYWLMLRYTGLSYRLALVIVLAVVATLTLVSSKYWAFADVRG